MASMNETIKREVYEFRPYVLKQHVPKCGPIPRGRSGHRIVSDNSCIYSFGGYNPCVYVNEDVYRDDHTNTSKLFKEFWKFNIARQKWRKLDHYSSSLPKQLASNAVLIKGNSIIVHGGTGMPFGFTNTNKTYIADLRCSTSFSLLPTEGDLPSDQYGQAMVLDGHSLYVVGGTTGFEYSVDVHCLNLKTRVWEEKYISKGLSNLEPQGRYRHEVALHNSRIIVFGGGTDTSVFGFEHLPAFNIKTKEWDIITTLGDSKCDGSVDNPCFPPPRRCHGSVQIPEDDNQDSEVVICGGFDGVKIFCDIWKLNLKTLTWTKCDVNLLYPLYFHSSSLSQSGQMFIFGGIREKVNDSGSYTVRTNEIFSVWVVIPKLKEICWEAMLYYNSDVSKYPKSKLLNSGVPKEFVERISS